MTQDNQNNFRPLPVLLMVLIVVVVALGGWWIKSQPLAPAANAEKIDTPVPQLKDLGTKEIKLTLYVPNDNAMLEKTTVTTTSYTSGHFADLAKTAVSLLLQKAPHNFPAGTKLLDVKTKEDGTALLNFNGKFKDASFWRGSATTTMGTYSIVNTIAALPADNFKAQQVRFLVEGKPIVVLGGLDVNDPLKPDMQWVQMN